MNILKKHIIIISLFLVSSSLYAQTTTCNIDLNNDQTICRGQSATICVDGADTYVWSNGGQSSCISVTPQETTTYELTATKDGCEATGHVTITINDLNLQVSEDQSICAGQSVEICANGAHSYWWSTGVFESCITVNPLETSTYLVVGGKNGCEDSKVVTINVGNTLNLQTSNDQTICAGQSVEICADGADDYLWENNAGNTRCITVSPQINTTYEVVAAKNECEVTAQVTVFIEDSFDGALKGCGDGKFGLADATGEWVFEHENHTYTKFYVGNDEKMTIGNNGRVGIGTDEPMYKLDVCGTIRGAEVLVEDDWCDYVFDKDYQLPSLKEEKEHIEANGYLLGFQSEEEMGGMISLNDVTQRQQVKIEEYALQLIQLKEQIEIMEKQNKLLTQQYHKLETMFLQASE